ncbi:MAG: hypothetical protein KZQ63_00540, partial [Candidatus Thiodiazotropha sp. (ex Lucinoma aequizonata)]|nr:hypothetical protein [Candidatus Thiodiazotropha sp. (ex Lucinoma aequizonata)]
MASKNKAATKNSIRPLFDNSLFLKHSSNSHGFKRVFDLVKDFGTSQSTKIDSIFDSLLCPDR